MKRYEIKIGEWTESILLLVIIAVVWSIWGTNGETNTLIMPSLKDVFQTFCTDVADGSLLAALGISMKRVLTGYVISAVLGIGLGIVIGLSKHMQRLTNLVIQIIRPIPPIAWIPLVILWMGIGEGSKVFLIFLGGFFPVLINVTDGICYTNKKLTEVAAVMETPRKKYITQLVIPAAMPSIFTGLKVSLGSCWTCVVAAELVASTSGIGYMISNARNFGQMDVVIVGMLSIGVVGKIMDVILNIIGKYVLAWNE
nr:ABC transporter permease [uncultured Anaerobutyricum sp.]